MVKGEPKVQKPDNKTHGKYSGNIQFALIYGIMCQYSAFCLFLPEIIAFLGVLCYKRAVPASVSSPIYTNSE